MYPPEKIDLYLSISIFLSDMGIFLIDSISISEQYVSILAFQSSKAKELFL
jgi:hypothetical protein